MQKEYIAPQAHIVTLQTADGVMDYITFGQGSNYSDGEATSKDNNDFDDNGTAWDEEP